MDSAGGAYSAPPDPLAGGEEAGFTIPKNPTTLSALEPLALALWASPPTRNMRLCPLHHDKLDLLMKLCVVIGLQCFDDVG